MSWAVHNLCLKAKHLSTSERMVLAAMAYFGSDDGTRIFASVEKIAEEAGLSVRQVQRIMHRLEGDRGARQGIIVCDRKPVGHRRTEYHIDLERLANASLGVQEVPGCHPYRTYEGCRDVTAERSRGDNLSDERCQDVIPRGDTDVTSIIDPLFTPLNSPTDVRVRIETDEREPTQPSLLLPLTGGRQSYPAGFEDIWLEFIKCPGFTKLMGKREALEAYLAIGAERPSDQELRLAVQRYAAELQSVNTARGTRGTPHPMLSPAKWFSSGRFMQFLVGGPSANLPEVDGEDPQRSLSSHNRARLRSGGFSDAEIDAWFGNTTFEVIDAELRISVEKPFQRNWIANHFESRLGRAFQRDFGNLTVVVTVTKAGQRVA